MKVVVSKDPGRGRGPSFRLPVRARWIIGGGLFLVLGLSAWHYVTLYTSMANARDDLLFVQDRFNNVGFEAEQGDIDAARAGIIDARDHLDTAETHFRYDPIIRGAAFLPGIGDQVDAADDLLDIASLMVDLGDEATAAAQTAVDLRDNRDDDTLLTRSLVDTLEQTKPQLDRAAEILGEIIEKRRDLGDGDLWRPLANAREALDDELPDLAQGFDEVHRAAELLPGFMGFEGERRYLVIALNSGELLPGGGLVTAAGVVTVNEGVNGEISFTDSNGWLPAAQALGIPYIEPPGPLKRYLLRDFSWNLLVSNWDPDYPTWSRQALEFYELVNGPQDVDGIVAVDLVVLEQLLTVTGPKTLDVPERGPFEFTPGNAVLELERMTRPAYVEAADDRKSIIGDLASLVLSDLLVLPSEQWADAIRTVRRMGTERHVQLFSFDPEEQSLIADVGWDGRLYEAETDYLHFNEASVLSTKLNLIIHPAGTLSIDVTELGDVKHELKLTYSNGIEEWSKDKDDDLVLKLMLGGLYGGYLRVFGPPGLSDIAVDIDGTHGNIEDTGREETADWFGTLLAVGPGETREVAFRWRTTPPGTSSSRYSLYIQKQPGTIGMCLDLVITRLGEPAQEVRVKGGTQDATGRWCLTSDMEITAEF
jgi:hypothetical protein